MTPAGTLVVGLAADTRDEAIRRLLHDAAHMPYGTWENFQRRGYTIENVPQIAAENPPLWCGHGLVSPYKHRRFSWPLAPAAPTLPHRQLQCPTTKTRTRKPQHFIARLTGAEQPVIVVAATHKAALAALVTFQPATAADLMDAGRRQLTIIDTTRPALKAAEAA